MNDSKLKWWFGAVVVLAGIGLGMYHLIEEIERGFGWGTLIRILLSIGAELIRIMLVLSNINLRKHNERKANLALVFSFLITLAMSLMHLPWGEWEQVGTAGHISVQTVVLLQVANWGALFGEIAVGMLFAGQSLQGLVQVIQRMYDGKEVRSTDVEQEWKPILDRVSKLFAAYYDDIQKEKQATADKQAELDKAVQQHEAKIKQLGSSSKAGSAKLVEQYESKLEQLRKEHEEALAQQEQAHAAEIVRMQQQFDTKLEEAQFEQGAQKEKIIELSTKAEQAQEQAKAAQYKAEESDKLLRTLMTPNADAAKLIRSNGYDRSLLRLARHKRTAEMLEDDVKISIGSNQYVVFCSGTDEQQDCPPFVMNKAHTEAVCPCCSKVHKQDDLRINIPATKALTLRQHQAKQLKEQQSKLL